MFEWDSPLSSLERDLASWIVSYSQLLAFLKLALQGARLSLKRIIQNWNSNNLITYSKPDSGLLAVNPSLSVFGKHRIPKQHLSWLGTEKINLHASLSSFESLRFSYTFPFSSETVLNDSLKLADVACPPLFPPRHGYLECSRPIDEISDGPNGGRLKITNRPGSQCILKCPTGYRLEGKFSKICGTTGEWIGDESGTCISKYWSW